ncbi:methylase involved in ubiquinone/menaquinonebiosynthesis-like protein [Janibacter sp. HTCC2649]|uniref:class I SAM-dependent methyltransferase n=1 Tax=Janibacter sp. HTCC2649 TaxID=313589 RepID=UPI000066E9F1|nr:class I SAM-dependent methyltransferase [Janibacter sp. HTCC2649]EAP99254.1 methylase involved in ubiquinone/menaquinonebiosynthesis-like protein [Janibacter sp. HTCC2649]
MGLDDLRRNWNTLGSVDPLWAILAYPEQHQNRWDEEEFFATGQQAVDEVMTVLDRLGHRPQQHGRALDFGCGAGRLTRALAAHFDRVDGVDIAASMIELAREKNTGHERVQFHLNEAADLSLFDADTFDLLLSIIVLQHIPNEFKKAYLAEFVRVLRPGGVAVFTVPSHADWSPTGVARRLPNRIQNIYRRRAYGYDSVMEFHTLRRRKVEDVITSAGGRILHAEEEPMAGPPFTSYLYVVGKDA